jgi:hypothetical protein
MSDEDREALAEAARAELACGTAWYIPTGESITDALLPVVDRCARRRAAEELRKVSVVLDQVDELFTVADMLRDRADALEAE